MDTIEDDSNFIQRSRTKSQIQAIEAFANRISVFENTLKPSQPIHPDAFSYQKANNKNDDRSKEDGCSAHSTPKPLKRGIYKSLPTDIRNSMLLGIKRSNSSKITNSPPLTCNLKRSDSEKYWGKAFDDVWKYDSDNVNIENESESILTVPPDFSPINKNNCSNSIMQNSCDQSESFLKPDISKPTSYNYAVAIKKSDIMPEKIVYFNGIRLPRVVENKNGTTLKIIDFVPPECEPPEEPPRPSKMTMLNHSTNVNEERPSPKRRSDKVSMSWSVDVGTSTYQDESDSDIDPFDDYIIPNQETNSFIEIPFIRVSLHTEGEPDIASERIGEF